MGYCEYFYCFFKVLILILWKIACIMLNRCYYKLYTWFFRIWLHVVYTHYEYISNILRWICILSDKRADVPLFLLSHRILYTISYFIFVFFKIKSTCLFILKVLKNNWILFVDCKLALKKSTVTQSGLRKYFDRTLISMQKVQWQLYTSCNVIPK